MIKTPRARVEVGGVDLWERYGLAFVDGGTVSPPAPKTYTVDIPGGDGCVDVTEALSGDVAYDDREMELCFVTADPAGFEATKTLVSGFLHGRRFDFTLSWDPGYTYTGRFSIDEYYSKLRYGYVKVTVDAEPYKLREHRRVRVAGGGGASAVLTCGRKRQRPVVECASECVLYCGGESVRLQPGRWDVTALWLSQGDNEVWVDSTPGGGDVTVEGLLGTGTVSEALGDARAGELFWSERPADDESLAVYFEYDIKEL